MPTATCSNASTRCFEQCMTTAVELTQKIVHATEFFHKYYYSYIKTHSWHVVLDLLVCASCSCTAITVAWAMHLQLCSISDIQQQYTATHKRSDVTNPKQLTPRYAKAAVGVSVSENHVLSGCHDCTCTYAILLCRRRFIVVDWFESSFELMTAEHVISTF
jgi:hypothetical protein